MSMLSLLKEYRTYFPTEQEWADMIDYDRWKCLYPNDDTYLVLEPLIEKVEKELGTSCIKMINLDYKNLIAIFDLAERYAELWSFS